MHGASYQERTGSLHIHLGLPAVRTFIYEYEFFTELNWNRLQSLWGKDADVWNPDRFMGEGVGRGGSNVGVYANL